MIQQFQIFRKYNLIQSKLTHMAQKHRSKQNVQAKKTQDSYTHILSTTPTIE